MRQRTLGEFKLDTLTELQDTCVSCRKYHSSDAYVGILDATVRVYAGTIRDSLVQMVTFQSLHTLIS